MPKKRKQRAGMVSLPTTAPHERSLGLREIKRRFHDGEYECTIDGEACVVEIRGGYVASIDGVLPDYMDVDNGELTVAQWLAIVGDVEIGERLDGAARDEEE